MIRIPEWLRLYGWRNPRLPRSLQDRSGYTAPHQSARERQRRIRQVMNGQLFMAGTNELFAAVQAARFKEVA
jgi:hypothetical protein